ncbi:MAG: sugar transferase [Synergistaceae bacterium]|nr:sugar transferase [Synergistaceae bacterium]
MAALNFSLSAIQIFLDAMVFNLCILNNLSFGHRAFFTGLILLFFLAGSMYGFKNWTLWEETKQCVRSSFYGFTLIIFSLYAGSTKPQLSRIIWTLFLFIPLCLTVRYFFRRTLFRRGLLSKSLLILGAGTAGRILAKNVASTPFSSRKILGFLDDDDDKQGKIIEGVPVLGKIPDVERVQREVNADEIAIAIPTASRKTLSSIIDKLEDITRRVIYVPNMYMLTTMSAEMRSFDGMPVISSFQGLLNPVNVTIKTIIDYIGAVIALILCSPFMLWAAWRIKREDGGPIFFIQDRIGWKGRHFRTYKFRSMHVNADEITKKLFSDPEVFNAYKEGNKLKDDPRLTKIGAFLRKTSIDELPQLFNVLKCEMSLVGPRPLTKFDVDLVYKTENVVKKVYAAKPGLTGIWQVSGRSDLDADFRRDINCYYVHNWSVWLDVAILMKTPLAVITSKGAY